MRSSNVGLVLVSCMFFTSSGIAADYWVDAVKGDDVASGLEATPWKTVQFAIKKCSPGDTVNVRDGQYDEIVAIDVSGTKENPISIRAQNSRKARLQRITIDGDFIRASGFEITSEAGGLQVAGIMISKGRFNEVTDNYIHDIPGTVGVSVMGEGNIVAKNRIYRMNKGINVGGKNNLIERNEVERLIYNNQDADYFRFMGDGLVFRNNWMHGTRAEDIGKSHTDGFQTFAVSPGQVFSNVTIEGNLLMDYHAQGMMLEGQPDFDGRPFSGDGLFIRNNVWSGGNHVIMAMSINNVVVTGNTFIGYTGMGVLPGLKFPDKIKEKVEKGLKFKTVVKNNIFYNCAAFVGWYKGKPGMDLTNEANLYYNPAKPLVDKEGGWSKDILNLDPMLVDAKNLLGPDGIPFTADDGYLLQAGSPAIDKGVKLEHSDAQDIFGTARPQGAGWDLGAQEYKR
ncbi:MAG: choice-of-anchor Q domain-containing protein [Planctomycetota bacterium]